MASGLVNPQWAKLRGAAERGGVALHFRGQGMFSFSAKALFQGEGKICSFQNAPCGNHTAFSVVLVST